MSKYHTIHNVHLAASSRTLTALLLCSLALPASAQNRPVARVAPEKQFTIPPDVRTPVVLQTEPDAACDLHDAGVSNPSQTMRLYGNIEGYVRFHFTPKQDIQDAHLELNCTTQDAVTTYPLHLRIAVSPTADLPAPETSVPAPAGSKVLPALTDEAARQLSDRDVIAQGYPPRPNTAESPEAYANWLGRVSRPITILPPHSVSRSDISHSLTGVTEGPSGANNSHWSGFVATSPALFTTAVAGEWTVPSVASCQYCYSSAWAGLDGGPTVVNQDVVQAGTEQDAVSMGSGVSYSYYAWTEAYPQQLFAQQVFNVSPGDPIFTFVFVGDSAGNINPVGDYAWFLIQDLKSAQLFAGSTKLGKNFGFLGTSAEWIVERPFVSGGFPELSDYRSVEMSGAGFVPFGWTTTIPYSQATNIKVNPFAPFAQLQQLTMTGSNTSPWYDNNVLSTVSESSSCTTCMSFTWKNLH